MKKPFGVALTILSMTTSLVAPAFAGGAQDRFSDSSDARAGFYLSIPFAGGLKPATDTHLSYGFRMGVGMSFAQNSFMDPRRSFQADMIKLSFSTRGFDTLAIGGQSLLNNKGVWFGATDGDDKSKDAWGYALYGIGAIALGVVVLGGGEKAIICPPGTRPSPGATSGCAGPPVID